MCGAMILGEVRPAMRSNVRSALHVRKQELSQLLADGAEDAHRMWKLEHDRTCTVEAMKIFSRPSRGKAVLVSLPPGVTLREFEVFLGYLGKDAEA